MKNNRMMIAAIATIYCLFLFPNCGVADQTIFVKDDFGTGIKSNIYESLGNKAEAKGITDDSGLLLLNPPCSRGKRVKASPVSPLFYEGVTDCSPSRSELVIKVTKKVFASNLEWNAEALEANGQNGNAALVYAELSTRFQNIDTDKANHARKKAYEAFAGAIKTPSTIQVTKYDKRQGLNVLTPEFVNFIKDYQKENNLPVTGMIDYKTLKTQSDISIGDAIFKKIRNIKQ